MWAIICASIFIQYPSQQSAVIEWEKYPQVVLKADCENPSQIDKANIDFYTSKDHGYTQMKSLAEVNIDKELEEVKVVNSTSNEKHCLYSFIRTGPNSLKMISECSK